MKNAKKVLLLVLCAVLLVGASVMGTIAYLTSTDAVKNTFTVGEVHINLDEANVATKDDETDRTEEGNQYHLLPGQTYVKDPTVTVLKDSEDCYVRMKVTVKNVDQLKAAFEGLKYNGVHGENLDYVTTDGMFQLHLLVDGWKAEDWAFVGHENGVYEFRYVGELAKDGVVPKNETTNTKLPALFTDIVVPGTLTNDLIANLEGVEINVEAHAIQAASFEGDVDEAWEAFGD